VGRVATGTEHVSPEVYQYVMSHSSPPDPVLDELRAETSRRFPEWAHLQIGPEQGTFMTLLSRLAAPRRVVEVGTFTGYSAICLARGLAPGGSLLCCDVNADWTALAREYWQKAGLDAQIELRLGPAAGTLASLPAEASVDLAFIDADKSGYAGYWDQIVPRIRSGGLILVDNTFMHGRIFAPDPDPDARAVRDFNEHALADDRVELAMLSVGDGLIFARKK
jgi:caffeoyl-CoA O-methyltransferase